jgi:predicted small lipoprotein YifL
LPKSIMRRVAAFLVLVVVLAACGTKGALYLPPPEGQESAGKQKSR